MCIFTAGKETSVKVSRNLCPISLANQDMIKTCYIFPVRLRFARSLRRCARAKRDSNFILLFSFYLLGRKRPGQVMISEPETATALFQFGQPKRIVVVRSSGQYLVDVNHGLRGCKFSQEALCVNLCSFT